MFHVADLYLYWCSVCLPVCFLKYIICFSCNNKFSDLLFLWKCTAQLPSDYFSPFIIVAYIVFRCSAFWNTMLAFSNSTAKLGWLFPHVIRERGGRNQIFIQFYILSQIYLFQEFIPFWFFFWFCPSIPSFRGWNDSSLNFLIEKISYTFILLVFENNF